MNLRRADADERDPRLQQHDLDDGAAFSARILQPGTMWSPMPMMRPAPTLIVAYPPKAFSGYRPPEPVHVEVTDGGFRPERIELAAAQGLIFDCRTPARILIALERPDDGPRRNDKVS